MKPEDLKLPYDWRVPRIMIDDGVFYVPSRGIEDYTTFAFPGWHELLKNSNPINMEYCSGNGAWLISKALANPDINWIGVEKKFGRARKIWSKVKNHQLHNVFIICGEALTATRFYFPACTVSKIFINFPDPWPKRRHAHNRLIQPIFLDEVVRTLVPSGDLTLVTDDPQYSELAIAEIRDHGALNNTYPYPHYTDECPGYGTSYFEELWRKKGKEIRYHHWAIPEVYSG